jgi:hypothetical protein
LGLRIEAVSVPIDPHFYDRADAVIHLANEQNKEIDRGKVSASLMYAAARFNSWVSACGFDSAEDMSGAKYETVEYFVKKYRAMLEENLDDYIEHFGKYMQNAGS